jgi:ABC-type sugar transport system ATPase subunit
VHQDLGLVTELSAVDNLALSRGYARTRLGSINWSEQERTARALIGRFGVDIDVHRPLMYATPVERTVVAIAAALEGWEGGRGVLVLDEPTAVLPHTEVDKLLEIVREVRRSGTSVLYVSHRMNEIFDLADRVTVLRGGRLIGTRDVADLTPQTLATMMVGEDVDISVRPEPADGARGAQLEVRDLRAGVLRGVSFELQEGEVLGIAGLPGSGRETLPYAIAGAWRGSVSGTLRLPWQSDAWIDLGDDDAPRFPLVPANRTTEGVISAFTVKENLTLPLIDRLRGRAAISAGREAELVDAWIDRLGIRAAGFDAPITTLSGGNQQKVVMARCLALNSSVLALCEPTAGVDIGTRMQLYDLIAEQARAGLGVIVSSSDEGDLLGMCTRVLVLRRGVIATELTGDEITEPNLLHAMEGSD